jgi:SAM-dependent methyltransferase
MWTEEPGGDRPDASLHSAVPVGVGGRQGAPGPGPHARAEAGGQLADDDVRAHFGRRTRFWEGVYGQNDVAGLFYRERMETAMRWVDELGLPPGSRVLEVGCGAGLATVELCRRGFAVEAVDSSSEMVACAQRRVAGSGLGYTAVVRLADVHTLPQETGRFILILALGVLPWLHSPDRATAELARVLAPGGHLIATTDNPKRLNRIVEPRENPALALVGEAARAVRRRRGWRPPAAQARRDLPADVDRMLVSAGLEPQRRCTVGFGPFTFRGRPFLGARTGIRLHMWLRTLSARRVPRLRRHGWDYLVSARRIGTE